MIGFVLGAFFIGKLAGMRKKPAAWWFLLSALAGHVVIYGAGVTWLSVAAHISFKKALALGLLPFVPGDALKCVAAALVAQKIKKLGQM